MTDDEQWARIHQAHATATALWSSRRTDWCITNNAPLTAYDEFERSPFAHPQGDPCAVCTDPSKPLPPRG